MTGERDNPPRLDLTPYCWKLQPSSDRRLRLVLFCVPGLEDELAGRLNRALRVKFRVHARGSLRLDKPEQVEAVARALGLDEDLETAMRAWAQTWRLCKKGVPTSVDVRKEQGRLVNVVLHLQGLNQ